jgi:hypothetical protein
MVNLGLTGCNEDEPKKCLDELPEPTIIMINMADYVSPDELKLKINENEELIDYHFFEFDSTSDRLTIELNIDINEYLLFVDEQYDTLYFEFKEFEGECYSNYLYNFYFNDSLICNQCDKKTIKKIK